MVGEDLFTLPSVTAKRVPPPDASSRPVLRGLAWLALLSLLWIFSLPDFDEEGARGIARTRAMVMLLGSFAAGAAVSVAWRGARARGIDAGRRWAAVVLGGAVGVAVAVEATADIWEYAQADHVVGWFVHSTPSPPFPGVATAGLACVALGIVALWRRKRNVPSTGVFFPTMACVATALTGLWLLVRLDRIAYLTATREVRRVTPGIECVGAVAAIALAVYLRRRRET